MAEAVTRTQPRIGHLSWDDPRASQVARVTLDGSQVRNVEELDDVEGWLVGIFPENVMPQSVAAPRVRMEGEVEVFLKTDGP